MYIVVVLSILAMMIPMSIPASAAGGYILLNLKANNEVDSEYNAAGAVVIAHVVGDTSTVDNWTKLDFAGSSDMTDNGTWAELTGTPGTETRITAHMADNTDLTTVKKWGGDVETYFTQPNTSSFVTWNEDGNAWLGTGSITDLVIAKFNKVETSKEYAPDGIPNTTGAQGMILNWYLVDGWQTVALLTDEAAPHGNYNMGNCGYANSLWDARFTTFSNGQTYIQTITDGTGSSTVSFSSNGAESVKIVVVPEYPGDPEIDTTIEVATYSFKKANIEAVPQVRWAGEKAILEADFGTVSPTENVVKFSLGNESNGELSAVAEYANDEYNLTNTTQTVWVGPDPNTGSMFPVAVEAQKEGKVVVDATLYALTGNDMMVMVSQQSFTVYFLQFNSLVLTDVIGKRVATDEAGNIISHKAGLWTEENPWDETEDWEYKYSDDPTDPNYNAEMHDNDTRNVSSDALLRARVTGWFGKDETDNPAGTVTVDENGRTINLPEGRYILPDDWDLLAGSFKTRPHWDIMCAPDSLVLGLTPWGPYYAGFGTPTAALVAAPPVCGPFSPSLEVMTNTGWSNAVTSTDPVRPFKTVVPDGALDKWDAPMPPAKIIFEILDDPTDEMDALGYFKDAFKGTVYYMANTDPVTSTMLPLLFTNPFYFACIPAHEYIPTTAANGWYDWDTFGRDGDAYGPYPFWQIMDPVQDVDGFPTEVEVYSDNHGEAMVYLNGDYNLPNVLVENGMDINYGTTVGTTTVQAIADYPYYRNLQAIYSETVKKTWTWGGQILGPDNMEGAPMVLVGGTDMVGASDQIILDSPWTWVGIKTIDPTTGYSVEAQARGKSNKHVVWIWATDRDGFQAGVLDTKVEWMLDGANARFFNTNTDFYGINPMYPSSELHFDANGFLFNADHPGERAAGTTVTSGTSWLKAPDSYESMLFDKMWGSAAGDQKMYGPDGLVLNANNFAVAAIEVVTSGYGMVTVDEYLTGFDYAPAGASEPGMILRTTNFVTGIDKDNSNSYPLDDPILLGDANNDGDVNTMDITAVERIILGMDSDRPVQADANYNGEINMGDVIRIEKIYLGID